MSTNVYRGLSSSCELRMEELTLGIGKENLMHILVALALMAPGVYGLQGAEL